ncbi:MAG TPA: hypothetical protein VIJ14_05960, partial [Rhabdochlamydiaceae bacterium]
LTTLKVSHMMGIYEIGSPARKSNSLPQLYFMHIARPLSAKDSASALSIQIDVEDGLKIGTSSTSPHQFQNDSFFTHILFFKIRGYDSANPSYQHLMVVPVSIPCGNKSLPLNFFHRCCRKSAKTLQKTPLTRLKIEILSMKDTLIPWCGELLQ